ncbi:MAG TPA: Phenylacetic acid catabolic protein [Blastocatellia bacterium]|jgi:benzoyl-CoA 2,3-dioxygenase component B|nr:Phenylacetic acid catabolic protein [Blastocatellia bacterium]
MAIYSTSTITPKYHDAIVDWQLRNFPELEILERHWDDYFRGVPPFQLLAKIGDVKSDTVEVGQYAGRKRFQMAKEMVGNAFFSARDIVRAQCSTELGSIQQHRLTLDRAVSDKGKFAVLRIMAEELRHAYQMFWVLDQDPTWKKPGLGDVAKQTIEELLSMELGGHVLDAFNIDFADFLDNVTYATVIDLVGKYQLEMQQVFSYAPMARSMGPMLQEEAFHLGSGRKLLKEIGQMAARGEGEYSIDDMQRALNLWVPRGLEMFGNEHGGETAMTFGFKDKTNGVAQAEYIEEVSGVIRNTNVAIVQERIQGISREDAHALIDEVERTGDPKRSIRSEDLLMMPDTKFFRKRGPDEIIFRPYDVRGNLLTEDARPLSTEGYLRYLAGVLPEKFIGSREYDKYVTQMLEYWAAK